MSRPAPQQRWRIVRGMCVIAGTSHGLQIQTKKKHRSVLRESSYNDAEVSLAVERALAVLAEEEEERVMPRPLRMPRSDCYRRGVNLGGGDEVSSCSSSRRRPFGELCDLVLAARARLPAVVSRVLAERLDDSPSSRAAEATRLLVEAVQGAPTGTLVELGAREADLTHAIAEACELTSVVLIDKSAPTAEMVARDASLHARRLELAIEDVDFGQALDDDDLIVVAKHICGPATDYALRAAARADNFTFLALAPCCYFDTTYSAFPNKPFLEALGFLGPLDFAALVSTTHSRDGALGQAAMDILDAGRVDFLNGRGYDARLIQYAKPHLAHDGALETTILLATKKHHHHHRTAPPEH